jgi:two-component system, chemotaxis family, protein-glutamate methylesterase/glutaminase
MGLSLPIRVLAVDDSPVMRALLRSVLAACPEIELVAMAQDGPAALDAMERLSPDLVLLDIEMPRMNGLEVLAEMHARHLHSRVIVCSMLTRRGAGITLEALARGATDYVAKPAAQHGVADGIVTLRRELLPRILALFPDRSQQPPVEFHPRLAHASPVQARTIVESESAAPAVLVIGVSTGGPAALERILPALPGDFPIPVLVVQHMPQLFTALLAQRLDGLCRLSVREAEAGEQARSGMVYLARGDWHLEVGGRPGDCVLRLTQGFPQEHCRPSVDVLFRSAASVYGAGALAVLLTGMGSDGLLGCRAVRASGGKVLVQDRQTSAVWGMPAMVARAGLADGILPLEAIAGEITRLAMGRGERKPA